MALTPRVVRLARRTGNPPVLPSVHVQWDDWVATVVLHGEFDWATTPALAAALTEVGVRMPRRVVIDLADVTFMDCAGFSPIARARQMLPLECPVILRSPGLRERRLLEITGLDHAYPVETVAVEAG